MTDKSLEYLYLDDILNTINFLKINILLYISAHSLKTLQTSNFNKHLNIFFEERSIIYGCLIYSNIHSTNIMMALFEYSIYIRMLLKNMYFSFRKGEVMWFISYNHWKYVWYNVAVHKLSNTQIWIFRSTWIVFPYKSNESYHLFSYS